MTFSIKKFTTMLLVLLISIGIVTISGILINPKISRKQDKAALKLVQELHQGATSVKRLKTNQMYDVDVLLNVEVYDANQFVGYAYLAKANNGYGHIEVLIYAQNNQINQIKITDMVQTMFQEQTQAQITANIGTKLDQPVVDVISGSSSSRATIQQIIQAVATTHQLNIKDDSEKPQPEPLTIYETWFGKGAVVTATTSDISTEVTKKEVVADKGFVYTVSMQGVGHEGSGSKTLTLLIAIDTDKKVLGYDFITYGHSLGNYRNLVLAYLEQHVKNQLLSELIDVPAGGTSDPTHAGNSIHLVMQMVHKVKEVAV